VDFVDVLFIFSEVVAPEDDEIFSFPLFIEIVYLIQMILYGLGKVVNNCCKYFGSRSGAPKYNAKVFSLSFELFYFKDCCPAVKYGRRSA